MDFFKRCWVEIDLDKIEHNYKIIREFIGDKKMISVVKADAYGHGVEFIAQKLDSLGTDMFAVSNLEEAQQLWRADTDKPILILGYTPPEYTEKLAELGVFQTVFSAEYAKRLSDAAVACSKEIRVHIKLDTGMHRIGFDAYTDEGINEAIEACKLPGLIVDGAFTHFASADLDGDSDQSYTIEQFDRFMSAVKKIEDSGVTFNLKHCCNSAGIFSHKEMHLDGARPGVILYGLMPSDLLDNPNIQPAMSFKSVISMIKPLGTGMDISYGRTFTAEKDMMVATVAVGYADGYQRRLAKDGYVLVNGKRAKIIGRICMDQMMIDVTDIPDTKVGDTVTLFGRDGDDEITVDSLAKRLDTINYELVCIIGKRVTRVFKSGGETVAVRSLIGSN